MDKRITESGFVACKAGKGFAVENGKPASVETHFPLNSVAAVEEAGARTSRVFVFGMQEEYVIANDQLAPFDPNKTGEGHAAQICNTCHVLKSRDEFDGNQTDAAGRKTPLLSCRICRRDSDKKPMTAAERREVKKQRPKDGTLFNCPVCKKNMIVGVTGKVVLDRRRSDGGCLLFLCQSCNTGLGRFKNGEHYLRNALAYLEEFEKSRGARTPGQS